MRRTQFMVHQILNAVQIQQHAGTARAAACQKKGARIFEAKGNQVSDNLGHDVCTHEREHVTRCFDLFSAAPSIACAVGNETARR